MLFSLSIGLKDKQIVTKVARHPGLETFDTRV